MARVLVACEFSGVVRDAFIERGYDAWSCDLLPTESDGPHIQGNVLEILDNNWDLMIAHPPCTYLANSGVRWLYRPGTKNKNEIRWRNMEKGAYFFKSLLECDIPKIAVENPIMHKHAVKIIGRRQDQIIHPHEHGHGESKSTCLWLKNLPKIVPTEKVDGRIQKSYWLSETKDRWKKRSITYPGIAAAFAVQWGETCL